MKKVHAKCEKNTRKPFIVCTGFVSPRFGIHGELVLLTNQISFLPRILRPHLPRARERLSKCTLLILP